MKFSCEKAILSQAVGLASRTVSPKSALEVLEGICVRAGMSLQMTGYNLETGITVGVEAEVLEQGSCVMPARLFSDIIRKLPDDMVTVEVDESYRARLDAFIRKNVAAGGQVYIVCPAVEQAEGAEEADEAGLIPLTADFAAATPPASTLPPLRAAVQYAAELAERLPDLRIGFVHGRMKQAEKDGIMQAFTAGEVQVLVSTTVIEVGVNVPNACLMIVENAERFGLSQLHQLRGRVGRGNRKSYCILVRAGGGDAARARLEVMRTTYDGFRIAEQDLAQRGPGDFLAPAAGGSIRQSGGFRLAEGWNDAGLMDRAFGDARALLASDPTLGEHPLLRDAVRRGFDVGAGDILN